MIIFKGVYEEPIEKAIQEITSYNGCIPSKDLNEYQYQTYLQVASPYELEKDIIFEATVHKVNNEEYKNPSATWNYSYSRLMRF